MGNDFFILMKQELLVAAILFLLLIVKISKPFKNETLLQVMQFVLLINFVAGFLFVETGTLFNGLYITNSLIAFEKCILNLAVYLISMLCADWLKKNANLAEFFMLQLAALLGMQYLISSGNLLMFYLSLELSTIPIAAMAGFDLHKKTSSEAAMKMILSSAFSSGLLLFGISLVYGTTGTLRFDELTALLLNNNLQWIAFIFLFTAFAFKLSIVPFHLWTSDVYEGAPISVTSFLSVASKGAVAFTFITVLYKVFQPFSSLWFNLIMVLSIASMLIGNLFALRQQNIKRFLAFSSIAQVGFILLGISSNGAAGTSSVVYFVLIYVFSNLAAFGVADIISTKTGKENINDYNGLYTTNPLLCWAMALALFSLAGIPPTAGFFGKLFLITAGASSGNYYFIIIAALNLIISLYYYLKIVRAMFMSKNENPIEPINIQPITFIALVICSLAILSLGLLSWVYDYIYLLSN